MRIRFPQSPLRLFRLGIAGALLCGCAAARPDLPGAEIGHLHRYTAEAGQQLRYGTTVEMQMSGDSALPIDMAMTMEMTVAMDILSAGPEGLEGEVGIEDLSLGGDMGQAMESVMGTGLLDVLKGTRTEFRVGPHGKIDDALSRGEIGTDMFSNVSQLSRMIFIRWPDRPIEAGATWQDSLVMQVNQMGVDLQSKILDDFTYQGIQAVDLEVR